MDLFTLALIIIITYALYHYFKKKLSYFEEYGIPYYPGLPLLGSMLQPILRKKHLSQLVLDIYNVDPEAKYTGAFEFNQPVIMLRDPDLIKSISIRNFDSFPHRKSLIDETIDPLFGGNLLNMTGDRWKEARNLLTPAFTSSKMKAMFGLMTTCGKNFVDYLSERDPKENHMVDTKELFTKYTNDVIAQCAFGVSVNSLRDPENDFYVYGKKATSADELMTIKFFMAKATPQLLKWFNIKFVADHVGKFFTDIVGATVKYRDENGTDGSDMLQLMMDARGKTSKNLKLDVAEITAQALTFFSGGFDTSSTQMCLIAHELAVNPDIQSKLQDEIDAILRETGGKPTYEAVNGMPYLDAVFNESMRLHTQIPVLDRLCTAKFELPPAVPGARPFTVYPGMNVYIPSAAIHRDPQHYEDPQKFDPERYYKKKVTINDVTNLGFGIGPRSCIGNRFAILETKISIFFLLSKFNLKPNSKTCIPFTYSKRTFQLKPEGGFWIAIEPRN